MRSDLNHVLMWRVWPRVERREHASPPIGANRDSWVSELTTRYRQPRVLAEGLDRGPEAELWEDDRRSFVRLRLLGRSSVFSSDRFGGQSGTLLRRSGKWALSQLPSQQVGGNHQQRHRDHWNRNKFSRRAHRRDPSGGFRSRTRASGPGAYYADSVFRETVRKRLTDKLKQ